MSLTSLENTVPENEAILAEGKRDWANFYKRTIDAVAATVFGIGVPVVAIAALGYFVGHADVAKAASLDAMAAYTKSKGVNALTLDANDPLISGDGGNGDDDPKKYMKPRNNSMFVGDEDVMKTAEQDGTGIQGFESYFGLTKAPDDVHITVFGATPTDQAAMEAAMGEISKLSEGTTAVNTEQLFQITVSTTKSVSTLAGNADIRHGNGPGRENKVRVPDEKVNLVLARLGTADVYKWVVVFGQTDQEGVMAGIGSKPNQKLDGANLVKGPDGSYGVVGANSAFFSLLRVTEAGELELQVPGGAKMNIGGSGGKLAMVADMSGETGVGSNVGETGISPLELTPEQQTALDSAKVAYAATGWEIQPSGEVLGAPEGVSYNVDKGVLDYTHDSYGVTITEPLIINTEDGVKPDGVAIDLQGYAIDINGNLVPKSYSSADGKNIESGPRLHSILEAQLFLANPDNVDMTVTGIDYKTLVNPYTKRGPTFVYGGVNESMNRYFWANDEVPIDNGKGGFEMKKTTVFAVGELKNNVTFLLIWGKDHENDPTVPPLVMLVDSGAPVPDDYETKNPEGWHDAYKDPSITVKW